MKRGGRAYHKNELGMTVEADHIRYVAWTRSRVKIVERILPISVAHFNDPRRDGVQMVVKYYAQSKGPTCTTNIFKIHFASSCRNLLNTQRWPRL